MKCVCVHTVRETERENGKSRSFVMYFLIHDWNQTLDIYSIPLYFCPAKAYGITIYFF